MYIYSLLKDFGSQLYPPVSSTAKLFIIKKIIRVLIKGIQYFPPPTFFPSSGLLSPLSQHKLP